MQDQFGLHTKSLVREGGERKRKEEGEGKRDEERRGREIGELATYLHKDLGLILEPKVKNSVVATNM